jgi:mannitol/fructose-specific phosphotransferase system IIA component
MLTHPVATTPSCRPGQHWSRRARSNRATSTPCSPGKDAVKHDAIVVLRFPDGVDWDGNDVRVAVGIAAKGNGHIALLSQLATVLLDADKAEALRNATTSEQVYALLASDEDDE